MVKKEDRRQTRLFYPGEAFTAGMIVGFTLEEPLLHEANQLQTIIIKSVVAVACTIIMTFSAKVNAIAYLVVYDVEFFAEAKVQSFHPFIIVMFVF